MVKRKPLSKKERQARKQARDNEARAWGLILQECLMAIKKTTEEMFEVVGQLNQHSARHAMQIRTMRKRLIAQTQALKDLEARVKSLELARSRFEGI